MIRAFFQEGALFVLPFGLFALYLILRRRLPWQMQAWAGSLAWLAMVGLGLILASFIFAGFFESRPTSGFEPTHMENGRLVPGRFR